ncbi:MAG: PA0069 family radical SAM protein [Bacteroidetes bacterium]|nr:PA0069 family radical SAM protein [Bacteroidota bacterium]
MTDTNPLEYLGGRGAQLNTANPYQKQRQTFDNIDFLDEPWLSETKTEYFSEHPKKIVNKVASPDIGLAYSMNPYQGCEHGCIYCYARNTHQYWGYSAGLDFERKIMIKENAPELLRKTLDNPKWKPEMIMLAGNTDCYQPIERKKKITRRLLEVLLEYKHPVGIITKNALVLRDIDLLTELAALNLLVVSVSITSLDEDLRLKMEPRTTTYMQRLKVVEELSKRHIPVNVMVAPVIPSINDSHIPDVLKAVAERGAVSAGYTIVRLNGAIGEIFTDWVQKNFPDRAEKVLAQIAECHGGALADSRYGTRMKGEGKYAEVIANLFRIHKRKYFEGRGVPPIDYAAFKRPERGQLSLF